MTARHGWSMILMTALLAGCSTQSEPTASARPLPGESAAPAREMQPDAEVQVAEAPPPEPRRLTDRPVWWLEQPTLTTTGFAATVEAEGASILDARAAAVDLAMQTAADHDHGDDARIDKTLIINPSPGVYKAFVYVSTPDVTTARVPESP